MKTKVTMLLALLSALAGAAATLAHPGGVDADGCHRDRGTQQRHCHPERASRPARDATKPPHPGDEGVFYGPVTDAIDGDSLKAKIQGVVMEFRLAGIDAPESDQPYGKQAAAELRALVKGRQITVVFEDVDRYGRVVGDVWVDSLFINRELVARGAAWFYPQFARDDALFQAEEAARDAKRGLWALSADERVEPWVWRERKRAAGRPDDRR
ncbi:MAG TPA: thermonuclease family protein [Povalibacter sp.]|uniref:thermonuclease family protein n=1 Tax=Povalibacter sp. TaxID=1962978 RepID=UPI002C92A080|nr:thermonuclease family protein [Povalibacter sp.]HMN45378.1 thermonuclease family protein [Povalibacter sp.]